VLLAVSAVTVVALAICLCKDYGIFRHYAYALFPAYDIIGLETLEQFKNRGNMFEYFSFLNLSTPELLLILLIALLLFGGRKLPELARSLGSSARELRNGLEEGAHEKKPKDSGQTNSAKTSS
jgi:TatA/E family protein of Tat protein translocase